MSKRKYSLVISSNKKIQTVEVLREYLNISLYDAVQAYDNKEFEADPSDPHYRELIDRLDELGVAVYDFDRIQLPKFEANKEPPSYT